MRLFSGRAERVTGAALTEQTTHSRKLSLPGWPVACGLFVLALIPRAAAQAGFVTVDEAYHWFERADRFRDAMRASNYAATNQVGHPGVTTMWLGAAGIELQRRLSALGWIDGADAALARALMRLPIAIVAALCVALAYPLLVRLLGRRIALLAALLWASEPFLVAHAQLLHVDALLTSFSTLALLTALLAFRFDADPADLQAPVLRWGWLAASGVCGGLALVTKSPALILAPMVGLIALVAAWRAAPSFGGLARRLWPSAIWAALAWASIVALVWVALWPAAWVNPAGAVLTVLRQAEDDGGSPHGWGNYFLGRAVSDPGPLFYPVALAFRLAPWTLLGLIVLPFALFRLRIAGFGSKSDALNTPQSATHHRPVLAVLATFVLLFLIMMSIPPKKFDRYALPVVPALDVLAAAGLLTIADCRLQIADWARRKSASSNLQSAIIWTVVVFVLVGNLAWYHPYEIAYYDPLLGGGRVAARAIPIGWGEGYELVGRFLNAQPDANLKPVATWFGPVLRPFVQMPIGPLSWALTPGRVGYAVLYIDQIQRADEPEATALFLGKRAPIYTARIHGIDYAYVYQVPPAIGRLAGASFGPDISLIGYDAAVNPAATSALTLTLNWQTRAAIPEDYLLFIHLLDARGQVIARADVPPGGSLGPSSSWQANRYITGEFSIPLAAAPAAGRYWLSLGLYHPASGQRLPLTAPVQPAAPDDGPDALRLPIDLTSATSP